MIIDSLELKPRCRIQIAPGQQCPRFAAKPLIYKERRIEVCALCYEIIMDKLSKKMKAEHSISRNRR
jgi:hypothetical protein